MTVPLRPQTRHIAANTVDSISMFLTPASYAFLKYSSFSSGEKEQRAPSSRPWPARAQQGRSAPSQARVTAVEPIRSTHLRRNRGCTWCFRSPSARSSSQRSTAAARWPRPRPAQCSWWWLYPGPPVRTGGGRRNPPLFLWLPPSPVPDLQTKPNNSCQINQANIWLFKWKGNQGSYQLHQTFPGGRESHRGTERDAAAWWARAAWWRWRGLPCRAAMHDYI